MTHARDAMDFGDGDAQRRRAFHAAGRHSNRVRWLKRVIVVSSLCALGVLAFVTFFNPFSRLPKGLVIGSASLNGSRITMENPRLSGYRDDGRPYDLRAASGAQDIRTPNVVDLTDIDARFDASDQNNVHLVAPRGTYDNSTNIMIMSGDIRITSSAGYDIRLRSATMNFKEGTVVSDEPVTVKTHGGAIAANRLVVTDHGDKIRFEDGVETTIVPNGGEAGQ